jgi:hypothetical protein
MRRFLGVFRTGAAADRFGSRAARELPVGRKMWFWGESRWGRVSGRISGQGQLDPSHPKVGPSHAIAMGPVRSTENQISGPCRGSMNFGDSGGFLGVPDSILCIFNSCILRILNIKFAATC